MLTLTDQDNGRHLVMRVGDRFEVRLAENASTGFSWARDWDDAAVVQIGSPSYNYPSTAVGSGGTAIFPIRVVGAGTSRLSLKHWRSWEGEKSVIQRFEVSVEASR